MQSTIHFLWCFVLVAFVTIAPSIATQENRTNQRKRHVRQDFDASTLRQLAAIPPSPRSWLGRIRGVRRNSLRNSEGPSDTSSPAAFLRPSVREIDLTPMTSLK